MTKPPVLTPEESAALQHEVDELQSKVEWLEENLRLAQHKRFGTSSERTDLDSMQTRLFNEAEADLEEEPGMDESEETITYQRKKKRRG